MDRPTLHVLGAGRTARALARVLYGAGVVDIGQVVNRSLESAHEAVGFIGAGTARAELDAAIESGWLMFGLPDGVIAEVVDQLSRSIPGRPALAFHLSGSVPADVLEPLNVPRAAVHPLRAFADPDQAAENFQGTWCVADGDREALARLEPVFVQAGGQWLTFAPRNKAAWHAATVAASNFLVTVNALARELAMQAGMTEQDAARLLGDLQHGTLTNLADRPASQALTGPLERGDVAACRRIHDAAHAALPPDQASVFDALAMATLNLAERKRGKHDSDSILRKLISD